MRGTTPSGHFVVPGVDKLLPLLGGAMIALVAVFLLGRSYVWAGLFVVGLSVFLGSLVARDFKRYWLCVFALSVPFDMKKLLIDSEYVRELAWLYGSPVGEIPGPVIYLSDLSLLILAAYWFIEITARKRRPIIPGPHLLALAFIFWCGLSLIKAPIPFYGIFELIRLIKLYLTYLLITNLVRTRQEVKILISCFLIGVVIQGTICIHQYISQDIRFLFGNYFGAQEFYSAENFKKFKTLYTVSPDSDIKRASGTVGTINAQAQYFELLLPISLALFLTSTGLREKGLFLGVFLLGMAGLVVTFSRGALVGILVAMAAVVILSWKFRRITTKSLLVMATCCALIGALVSPAVYSFLTRRPEATQARFDLYRVGLRMVQAHPVLGVGLQHHVAVKPQYELGDGSYKNDPSKVGLIMPVHNHYLIIASEVGVPGLLLIVGFFLSTAFVGIRVARSADPYLAAVAIGVLGALLALAIHNLVDFLNQYPNLVILWLEAGLIAVMERISAPAEGNVARSGPS